MVFVAQNHKGYWKSLSVKEKCLDNELHANKTFCCKRQLETCGKFLWNEIARRTEKNQEIAIMYVTIL